MKKGLLCIIVMLIMVLPLVLTSCGNDMTAEEIANANFQKADKALTLSVWLPVPASVYETEASAKAFNDRLVDVEAAINDYLRTNNYCTVLDFCTFNEDVYYDELTKKFGEINELNKTNKEAHVIAEGYVNYAKLNPETQIYEMAYPSVLDNQLDIFFVGGYEQFTNYINNGDVYALDKFFTEGQAYNSLFKSIRGMFLNATKINNAYYAIPNNHVYSDKGQYILVNKELYNTYSDKKWDDTFTLQSLKGYIEKIGESNLTGVVPYVGTTETIPGIVYLDKANLVAASLYNKNNKGDVIFEPEYLPNMSDFKEYMDFYLNLSDKSYVSGKLGSDEVAAVQIYDGNLIDFENVDDYYVIETIPPYASVDTLYSSMFAISTHSANYERAMQMLCLLQDNTEIRTLLQYGIEEEDYRVSSVNGEKVIITKDSGYVMDMKYTGNCYRTYPASGVPMSAWEDLKNYNLETEIDPYLATQLKILDGKLSDENKVLLNQYLTSLGDKNSTVFADFGRMSYAEYCKVATWIDEIGPIVSDAQNKIKDAQDEYDRIWGLLDVPGSPSKQEQSMLNKQLQIISEQQEVLDSYSEYVTFASNYAELLDLLGSEDNINLVKLYQKIK